MRRRAKSDTTCEGGRGRFFGLLLWGWEKAVVLVTWLSGVDLLPKASHTTPRAAVEGPTTSRRRDSYLKLVFQTEQLDVVLAVEERDRTQ